jgi:serine/threonine protein kinase
VPLQAITATEPIPGYRIRERIGAGGYGEVWRADAPGGLAKAIKFVYGYLDEDRASRELKALNRIKSVRHPFLVSLERIEVVDGQLLIVTELAEASLKERYDACREAGLVGIPRAELLKYLQDAADALDFMSQEHSLQHLDIKPENLLMLAGRVKVADFGLVKDIKDVTGSMMGGLTPLYAPPEVFDGRPSRRSDQYSLAIVYQEMLTGELPFPGTTAVQLARQHLHANPRISALPEHDQPAIAQALSKNPSDRFGSCCELIDALNQIGNAPAAQSIHPDVSNSNQLAASRSRGAVSNRGQGGSDTGRSTGIHTSSHLPRVAASPAVTRLPPIVSDQTSLILRPTLFLGAGHTAGRVLGTLKRRLEDQFGDLKEVPIFQTLLVDTDGRDLLNAARDQRGELLTSHETMALPLRRPQDYRDDSKQLLKWLSRRWLYNIPRSLKTEGLRPLGRLALIDHAPELLDRLRQAMAIATDERGIDHFVEATGCDVARDQPRVIVVASINGGTGSGMVLDLGYAARQLLAELDMPDDAVLGVLLNSTSRDQARSELEMVNAYSTLMELNHFCRWGGYWPGEEALELPPRSGDNAAFATTYLLHLGHELAEEQFTTRTENVAEYLFLDAATAASNFFQACRQQDAEVDENMPAELQLRTFGLRRLSCLNDDVIETAVEYLCRYTVDIWALGQQPTADSSEVADQTDHAAAQESRQDDANRSAAQIADSLQHTVKALIEEMFRRIEYSLDTTVDNFFRNRLQTLAEKPARDPITTISESIDDTQQFLKDWLGSDQAYQSPTEYADNPTHLVELKPLLDEFCEQAAAARAATLRERILVEVDGIWRVQGAQELAKSLHRHCKDISQQATEMEKRLKTEAAQIDAHLATLKLSRGRRQCRKALQGLRNALMQLCRQRLLITIVEHVTKIANHVKAQVSAVESELVDLKRDLRMLADQFSPQSAASLTIPTKRQLCGGTDDPQQNFIAAAIHDGFGELVKSVADHTQQEILQPAGGLRNLLALGGGDMNRLPQKLRSLARATVVTLMKQLDATSMLQGELSSGSANHDHESLAQHVAATQPELLKCGGAHRLLVMAPASSDDGEFAAQLSQQLDEQPSILASDAGDFTLCREVEQISLTQAAVFLIDGRRDLADTASRLHARMDVQWSKLPDIV